MKELSILILFIFGWMTWPGQSAHAQGENNNWAFGYGSGLNFNSGSPVFFQTSMFSKEGCAAISDAFGNLLFYTSGNMIWDRKGKPMPHGNIVGNAGGGSGTQAALILKSLSNPDEYYVFTLDPQEIEIVLRIPKLRYSIVNMTLNEGMGDVKPGAKDIVIDDEMEERMVAVESDDCGYWIVSHKRHSNIYAAYKLNENGVQLPVYSVGTYTGKFWGSNPGEIKISPDKSKIALAFYEDAIIEIGEFNHATGVVSNTQILDSNRLGFSYGLSFSPDNSKLYSDAIYQYDMLLYPNVPAMRSGKLVIGTSIDSAFTLRSGGLRIGPDKKIYLTNTSTGFIACFNSPNSAGPACDFVLKTIEIPATSYLYVPFYGFNLGNETVSLTYKDTLPGRFVDTLICYSDSVLLSVNDNLLNYTWNDGTKGSSRYVKEDGFYCILSSKGCTMRMDTFNVTFVKGNLNLGADTVICPGDSLVLSVSGEGFRWQDGSIDSVYVINRAGRYFVSIHANGCSSNDTLIVGVYDARAVILENDTLICKGEQLSLHGLSIPSGLLRWNTGADSEKIVIKEPGSYILEAENICGTFSDSVIVGIQDCNCQPGIPNAFSPNGDGLNDQFRMVLNCLASNFQLSIYNRFGGRVFSGYEKDLGWDGTYKNQPADVGTYYYYLLYETPNGVIVKKQGDVILIR